MKQIDLPNIGRQSDWILAAKQLERSLNFRDQIINKGRQLKNG